MYGDQVINPPARRFPPEELDRALDNIIKYRRNLNNPVSWQNTQSASSARPASGTKPRKKKRGPSSGQPILDDVLELPNAPVTQSASIVRPASGRKPWQQTRSGQPILEEVIELPDAPSAIPTEQSPCPPAPAHPPARILYGNLNRALDENIDGPQRSVPWAPHIRPKPRSGPSRLDQDSRMDEAPPIQPRWPRETITQPRRQGPTNGRPALWAPNDRPTQSLPFGHDSTMADTPPASDSRPHAWKDQPRTQVPTRTRSDVRPAPVFFPASAPQSGPASPHGKLNQPGMPVPTGPRSIVGPIHSNLPAFAHTRTNQPVVPVPTGRRSDVRPPPSLIPASEPQSGPAFPHGKANQPRMTVPNRPRSNKGHVENGQPRVPVPAAPASRPIPPSHPAATQSSPAAPIARLGQHNVQLPTMRASNSFQALRTHPASAAPTSPASFDPRIRSKPREPNIGSAHNSTPDSGRQSSSSTFQDSGIIRDHPAVGRGLERKESQRTNSTHTAPRPEGASSTHNPQFDPAQSFDKTPSAQASQQTPQSSLLSSPSNQAPGISFATDSTQASRSQRAQRDFKIIRMRIVENAITVRSGYALLWD